MTTPLYTPEILRLAASIPVPAKLERIDCEAEERSPTCGSRVRVELQLDEERRILSISQEVHACAFGQASAALLAAGAPGKTYEAITSALVDLSAWLAGGREDPGEWPGFAVLEPARPKRARHAAILLPFRAVASALERRSA
ncbi:MAG TPA: iron-sulfur cluster assembly scaffold protein [Sphingomicrobium sp.]|nr:iron-sulfur cluster assembly scaffold protein [Sphingomicrobium sp.]